ncbi:MAG: sigma-54-dependent Fis family transcriptional regulator [Deltaproteobacteria bacterium]|nr:sigma-54-dependent Fis family transcriptional regulator [Deltaproteobacteria bacterium]
MYLQRQGFEVTAVPSGTEAMHLVRTRNYQVVVTDLRLGKVDGLQILRSVKKRTPETEVILITGFGSVDTAVQAMKVGAYDYLTKPVDPEDLVLTLKKALERRRLRRQVAVLQREVLREAGLSHIVAESEEMRRVMTSSRRVAGNDATVLLEGESGTGKELIAKYIHHNSGRASGPFIAVNCGALTENLLESELFGHVKGSFTGAVADKKGLFQAADGGTLFLDEIGETSPTFQVKLLRVLQDSCVRPVGGTTEYRVDVRIIAASNKDLEKLVEQGRFRQDLYYRLKVVPIYLPPLRHRPVDIRPLAEHFISRYADRMGRNRPHLSRQALGKMQAYSWPGNVRELENTIERTLIFLQDREIRADDLPLDTAHSTTPAPGEEERGADLTLKDVEKRHIKRVLELCEWNQRQAARTLGIGYNTLWRKMKRYRIARPQSAGGRQ